MNLVVDAEDQKQVQEPAGTEARHDPAPARTGAGMVGPALLQRKLALRAAERRVQRSPDPEKGISDGKTTLEDFYGGDVGSVAKGKAGLAQATENNSSLVEQAKSIKTQTARSEKEMLEAIAAGGTPRFVARVSPRESFTKFMTFGRPGEFVFATEPADLRGCSPAAAMVKVGWTKQWILGAVGKEIVVCILDTQKAVATPTGDKKVSVGKMEWPDIIAKAMGDAKFKSEAQTKAGITDDNELKAVFDILKSTPVKAEPKTKDSTLADKAKKVRALLDTNYGANELYTGMGATMNTEGKLGAREVMVMNNDTGLKLTPDNHVLESLGVLKQDDADKVPA